jgi:hypothetical protein
MKRMNLNQLSKLKPMKKLYLLTLVLFGMMGTKLNAQEEYGHTLNIGAGIGYYGYIGHTTPAIMLNYEFDLPGDFTVAPFIGFYSYSNYYYWGDQNYPYRNYSYRETVVPLGAKFAYYFDDLLHAGKRWDFYGAASLGVAFHTVTWENGYYGDRSVSSDASPLYLNLHIGARYYVSDKVGLFLDLSTGMSTVGVSFHFGGRGAAAVDH